MYRVSYYVHYTHVYIISRSEDGSETQSSEYHSSHSGSSGKSYCTDPSNPFKKCHVSHREIENLKHIPPPPPVMTSGGSSVTLLTKLVFLYYLYQ